MLDRFISTPTPVGGFQLNAIRPDHNPVLEGYGILRDCELESLRIIEEHTLSTFYGISEDSPEIIMEGLGDMLASAAQFFKELIRKLTEFFKKTMLYLTSMFVSFEKFLDKYKDKLLSTEKSYTVWGYEYTLNQSVPKTDAMSKIVSEFNSEMSDVTKLKKGDLVKRREEFVNENHQDALRGQILGLGRPIEAGDSLTELRKMFRSNQEEEKEIRVDKAVLQSMMANYKLAKKKLDETRNERDKIEGVYRSLEQFFARGVKYRYEDGNRKIVTKSPNVTLAGKDSSANYKDETSVSHSDNISGVINYYYSFKWKQAQSIGAISFQAFIEKINAIKEAMTFYEKSIRRAIFATPAEKGED